MKLPVFFDRPPAPHQEIAQIRGSLSAAKRPARGRIWLYLFPAAALLLLILAGAQLLTPRPVSVPRTTFVQTNANNTQQNITQAQYTGPTPDLPFELPVYQSSQVLQPGEVLSTLLARYGLVKPDPEANYWVNGNIFLIFEPTRQNYKLVLKQLDESQQLPVVNPAAAQQVADRFLATTFPQLRFKQLPDRTQLIKVVVEQSDEPVPAAEATGINFSYTLDLGEIPYPVYFEKTADPAFVVSVDGENTVISFLYYPLFNQFAALDTRRLVTVDQALRQIEQGTGSIIQADVAGFERMLLSEISQAEFSAVSVEYRQDPNQTLLYPFYRFRGTGRTQSGAAAEIQVITPALALQSSGRN